MTMTRQLTGGGKTRMEPMKNQGLLGRYSWVFLAVKQIRRVLENNLGIICYFSTKTYVVGT